jgi:microcystin-dependent protein
MAYTVNFSNSVQKTPIVVDDNSRNTSDTSLTLIGRNEPSYGQAIAENFVRVLENFANDTPPNNPIEGQLWFDSGTNRLRINDSTAGASNWRPAGGVHVEAVEPSNPLKGDVWVDTTNNQLYLYTGAQFQLVGPNFAGGLQSGAQAEEVIDTKGVTHTVIKNYVADKVVTIISKDQFIPRQVIEGFSELYPGVNISATDFDGNGIVLNKLHATATKADALNVTQPSIEVVNANNFLRSDITDTTSGQLYIRNDGGLTIGSNQSGTFEYAGTSNSIVLKNSDIDGNIDFKVYPDLDKVVKTVLRIEGRNKRVGINNLSPTVDLDVTGAGHFSDSLIVSSTTNVDTTLVAGNTGALRVAGGMGVGAGLQVGGNATFEGHLVLGEIGGGGGIAILPRTTNNLTIGGDPGDGNGIRRFSNIYSETFTGRLVGTMVGDVNGNVNGTADRLVASTVFKIGGHVADSTGFSFDGQTGGSIKTFNVSLTQDAITDQGEVSNTAVDDFVLVARDGAGLKKISYQNFFTGAATVPIGAIMPYAGATAPTGYLLCDGSEVPVAVFNDLYNVIGNTYGTGINPATFKLPDLRGRFALGKDNMDNNRTVQDTNNLPVDAGGGVAGRVTDTNAQSLAGSGGREIITTTSSAVGTGSQLPGGSGAGAYTQLNVMNPFLTVNYIIRANP